MRWRWGRALPRPAPAVSKPGVGMLAEVDLAQPLEPQLQFCPIHQRQSGIGLAIASECSASSTERQIAATPPSLPTSCR